MRVDELAPAPGSTKRRKRVGRGIGGKGGKTDVVVPRVNTRVTPLHVVSKVDRCH